MKTTIEISIGKRLLVFVLCALCASVVNIRAQDFKTVHDGVEYAQVVHKLGSDPVKINLLRLDLKKVRLDVHHAMDAAIGTEKTSSIATRHGAVAAINAGFFRLDKSAWAGEAAGVLMVNGKLLSESLLDRATLLLLNGSPKETHVLFGHYQTKAWIQFGDKHWGSIIELSGIDRERKASEAILLSEDKIQKLAPGEMELRLNKCSFRPFSNSDVETQCDEIEILRGNSDRKLKNPQFVVVLDAEYGTNNSVSEKIAAFETLSKKIVIIRTRIKDGNTFPYTAGDVDITNGIPQLIKSGKIDITWEQEKAGKAFAETRHPRTAVAKLKNGKFLMITVDGRQPGVSVGMNLQELAEYLFSLGAVDAMNLDGGGSTTMFLDGKVVNTPSDKEGERKIGDAILVTLRTKR
mgnify:CR=1 FL=1